jgi:uncharacterized protein (TIGR03067 family)
MQMRAILMIGSLATMIHLGMGGDSKSEDAKNLQGTWAVQSFEFVDKLTQSEKDFLKETRIKFTTDQTMTFINGKEEFSTKFRLAPGNMPKQIDMFSNQPSKGEKRESIKAGIYELTGDMLKLCYTAEDVRGKDRMVSTKAEDIAAARPREFKGSKDHILFVLKREKRP